MLVQIGILYIMKYITNKLIENKNMTSNSDFINMLNVSDIREINYIKNDEYYTYCINNNNNITCVNIIDEMNKEFMIKINDNIVMNKVEYISMRDWILYIFNYVYSLLFYLIIINFIISFILSKKLNINNEIKIINYKNNKSFNLDNYIGCSNVKKEITQIINYIKHFDIYNSNNCYLPKGIILMGSPGCGKTYLVKCISQATGINLIFNSGSDINQIYVGSGSAKINKIYKKARENKPCIVFFDEADTIIRKRTEKIDSHVSSEFNSTINKLLTELDSLSTENGVITIFATNMKEELIDKAILRAGRVDKIINIDEPTMKEREELFRMYLKEMNNEEIEYNKIVKYSAGLTGSDIKKISNNLRVNNIERLIDNNDINNNYIIKNRMCSKKRQVKKYEYKIKTEEIESEINKCIMGFERDKKINIENKKLIAYHEAGHAFMAFILKDYIKPTKICISITNKSLGYTLSIPDEEDLIIKSSLINIIKNIMVLYSGRACENIFMNMITCGAEDDYMKARRLMTRIIKNGMMIRGNNMMEDNIKFDRMMEEKMKEMNVIIMDYIDEIIRNNEIIVREIGEKIENDISINDEDIREIFRKNNMENLISSIEIGEMVEKIKKINLYKKD
jgi:cell division protease FtsH